MINVTIVDNQINKRNIQLDRLVLCVVCNHEFWWTSPELQVPSYCSLECYYRKFNSLYSKQAKNGAGRTVVNQVCLTCKKIFQLDQRKKGKFCSKHCYDLVKYIDRETRPCAHCGEPIILTPSEFQKGRKYCSQKCTGQAQRRRIETRCTLCGVAVIRPASALHYRYHFCSNRCCRFFFIYVKRIRMRYTPEFLQQLRESDSENCPFPECDSPRASRSPIANPWGLCRFHGWRIYNSLHSRRRAREAMLQAAGLETEGDHEGDLNQKEGEQWQ